MTHCPSFLPPPLPCDRWFHLQHVCCEPGPLSALPGLQTEGPPGTAAPGPFHIKGGGKRHRPTLGSPILISSQLSPRPVRSSACSDPSLRRPACPQADVLPSNQGGCVNAPRSPCLLCGGSRRASSAVYAVHTLSAKSMGHGPAASVSPGSLLDMQNLGPQPRPTEYESAF